jgi:pimeloyl-ACP methyl ester carboxylesterase
MVNWYRAAFRHAPDPSVAPRRVSVPTLVLVAAEDAFIPADMTRRSVELCDQGRLLELGFGTHWVAQEQPGRLAAILAAYFRE